MSNKYLLFLVLFFFVVAHYEAQKNAFESYFSKINEIKIPDEIIIGEISYLDFDDSNLLLTDRISKKVLLINYHSGKLITELDIEKCLPGFHWLPISAHFNGEEILLLNAIPWGYRFTKNGKCLGQMVTDFVKPQYICFLTNNIIVGLYNDKSLYLQKMEMNGRLLKKGDNIPEEFKNFTYRYEGGGVVSDFRDNIYFISSYDWQIKKFDKNLNFIKKIGYPPSYFRKIENDISREPNTAIIELGKVLKDKTTTLNIFLLSPNKLLIQYYNPNMKNNPIGISLIDTEGNNLLDKEIQIFKKMLLAKHNKVFFYVQPKPINDRLPNPIIEIYELNDKSIYKKK